MQVKSVACSLASIRISWPNWVRSGAPAAKAEVNKRRIVRGARYILRCRESMGIAAPSKERCPFAAADLEILEAGSKVVKNKAAVCPLASLLSVYNYGFSTTRKGCCIWRTLTTVYLCPVRAPGFDMQTENMRY